MRIREVETSGVEHWMRFLMPQGNEELLSLWEGQAVVGEPQVILGEEDQGSWSCMGANLSRQKRSLG